MAKSTFIIINSFDRSGSSFLGNMLSKHPQIETLFHPFNSSVFSRTRFEYWGEDHVNNEANELVDAVIHGDFKNELIKSHWLRDFSSSLTIDPNKLYVIKTTNLHFKIDWFRNNYPELEIYPLLRNPIQILNSLVRNDLLHKWYGDWANKAMDKFMDENEHFFTKDQMDSFKSLTDDEELMLATIVINNEMMLKQATHHDNVLHYEKVKSDCNGEVDKIINKNNLSSFDFTPFVDTNFNLAGDDYESSGENTLFSEEKLTRFNEIVVKFNMRTEAL